MIHKHTTHSFILLAKKLHKNNYDYSKVCYVNNKTKIKIFCKKCQNYFYQRPDHHLFGHGCPFCKNLNKTTQLFIKQAYKIHKGVYDYSQVEYRGALKKINIVCTNCHRIFQQTPHSHLCGKGCPYCNGKFLWTTEKFIEKAKNLHNESYDYTLVQYAGAKTKIQLICNNCRQVFMQTPEKHLLGHGCLYCKQSKGEIRIQNWLEKHKIKYEIQKCFKGCKDKKPLSFDFYLPKYNLCIEFQGKQHYEPICRSVNQSIEQAEKAFKLQQKHDKIKKEYCKKNNIAFLEIKHDEDIEKIISSFVKL